MVIYKSRPSPPGCFAGLLVKNIKLSPEYCLLSVALLIPLGDVACLSASLRIKIINTILVHFLCKHEYRREKLQL